MTDKEKMETLEQIADIVTDLLFCGDNNEKNFCEEVICRKLEKLGYINRIETDTTRYWMPTTKSKYLKEFTKTK